MNFSHRTFLTILALALLLDARTEAFDLNYNTSGNPAHWSFATPDTGINTNVFDRNTHAIRFYVASDAYSTTNTAAEINAVRNCFGQWQSVPNTIIKFEDAGLARANYDVNTADNSNVVYWAKSSTIVNGGHDNISGALGITFATYSVPSNVIQQFDIVLNGVEKGWFTDFNDAGNPLFFVEGTLTHEIGHSLGAAHAAMGGATMLYAGTYGIGAQAALTVDEVAFARTVYPAANILSNLAGLKGTVTKNGAAVLGAVICLEGTNGILAASTVSLTNGSYRITGVPPGSYNVRVTPLDPSTASAWLIRGSDVQNPQLNNADTAFLPTTNSPVSLTAGTTNTLNLAVSNGTPAFRIALVRQPSSNPGAYSIGSLPCTLTAGQSNYTIGVFSDSLPTSGASVLVTGDGLTLGSPTYQPGTVYAGLNGISVSISVASNATPGLRSFLVQSGTNRAYANGFVKLLPAIPDYNFDSLDDRFQRRYFFPFTQTNAAPTADPDKDGFNNLAEYIAGTIPTNAASALKLQSISKAANGTTVTWQSISGKRYQLQGRTALPASTWQNVGSVVTAAGDTAQWLDASATNGQRFYRVQVLP